MNNFFLMTAILACVSCESLFGQIQVGRRSDCYIQESDSAPEEGITLVVGKSGKDKVLEKIEKLIFNDNFARLTILRTSKAIEPVIVFNGYQMMRRDAKQVEKILSSASGSRCFLSYCSDGQTLTSEEIYRASLLIPSTTEFVNNSDGIILKNRYSKHSPLGQYHTSIFKNKNLIGFTPIGVEFSEIIDFACICVLSSRSGATGRILALSISEDVSSNEEFLDLVHTMDGFYSKKHQCVFFSDNLTSMSREPESKNFDPKLKKFIKSWIESKQAKLPD